MIRYDAHEDCARCGGFGYTWIRHENPMADNDKEQCLDCELLIARDEKRRNEMDGDELNQRAKDKKLEEV